MLTWDKSKIVGYDANGEPLEKKEGYCMSTDDKPTGGGIANGSKLDEINTGTEYRYDQAGAQWHAKSGGGGGSGLPAVTSDDNGDVLTVVNGAWDKAAPSGGGSDIFVVTYTDNSGTLTYDKTLAEIYTAIKAGKNVMAIMPIGDELINTTCFSLSTLDEENDDVSAVSFVAITGFVVDTTAIVSVQTITHLAAYENTPESATLAVIDVDGTPQS